MERSSLHFIGVIAKIAAVIGVALIIIGSIVNTTATYGSGKTTITVGGSFIGLAFALAIVWLVVDAITESIDRVRETIVARWIDDSVDADTER